MALDEALMSRARRTGDTVMRVYAWAAPTLSLGRNQRAVDVYDEERLRHEGITVLRRPTGGRALLHHREITYSVTAPVVAGETVGAVHGRINELLVDALSALGVPAAIASPARRTLPPGATPCFAEPAAGELVLGGRKLAGSAQWRDDGALLQHGSILIDDDQSRIPGLIRRPDTASPTPPPATLRDALGRAPALEEVAEALFGAVRRHADPGADTMTVDAQLQHEADARVARFRDPAWTWRR
jgi:lipoate-protein ligase A